MNWENQRTYDEKVQRDLDTENYRDALESLVLGYQHVLIGFCTNMLGDADFAQEVAQEIFLAAYKAMPRFRQNASIRTWLFAIARRQCLKALRDRARRRRLRRDKEDVIATTVHREPPPPLGEDPEAQLQRVKQHLGHLEQEERTVLMMRYDTGLPIADMATILGLSVATVRRRLVRALQRLREVMHDDA
jgi:RNA polymerase sigma-70 factor (ECF subfamily)